MIKSLEEGKIVRPLASLQSGAPMLGRESNVEAPAAVSDQLWDVVLPEWGFQVEVRECVPLGVALGASEGGPRCVVG